MYRSKLLYGDERGSAGKLSEKWKFLLNAPFKISEQCCDVMKKKPIKIFEKENRTHSITGEMASDSNVRAKEYLKNGCNAFDKGNPKSTPIGFWTEQDVLKYLKEFNVPYSSAYGDIIEIDGVLKTTGVNRTGCMFCMFGCHLEKEPNRFQQMKLTHPKLHDYCINKLGCGEVLDYIGVKYE